MVDRELLMEMIDCASREVKRRKIHYPKLVTQGYMTQNKADRDGELMRKIEQLLFEFAKGKNPDNVQLRLL